MIRRLHIAGSANADADATLLADTHALIRAAVDGWVALGGTLVGGIGGEPLSNRDATLSIIFDWTVAEVALAALQAGKAQPRTDSGSLLCVRISRRAFEHIPEHRKATFDALTQLGALDLKLLPDGWRSGALIRRAQVERGDVLMTLSGGAGVEDLVNLYAGDARPVVPIDVDLGSSGSDAAQGGGTGLARRALSDPDLFLRLADGSSPVAALTQLSMDLHAAAQCPKSRGHGPSTESCGRSPNNFDARALAVSGLDREALLRGGMDPKAALDQASDWIAEVAGKDRAVMVAWPLAYDWLFLQWYFLSFASAASPFGFSSCVDMKTMFWRHAATVLDGAGKDNVPGVLRSKAEHTHNALDDAVEQAELFVNLWRADKPREAEKPEGS